MEDSINYGSAPEGYKNIMGLVINSFLNSTLCVSKTHIMPNAYVEQKLTKSLCSHYGP